MRISDWSSDVCSSDLESARQAAIRKLIEPILVGDSEKIRRIADEIGWDLGETEIVHAAGEDAAAARAAALAGAGEAQALMKGHVHTDVFMTALLRREAGLRTGRRLTHVFHMTVPGSERVLLITDEIGRAHV